MKIAVITSFCLVLAAATAASGASPANTAQESSQSSFQQELVSAQKAFLEAMARGDAQYLKNTVADDFMSIETNGDSSGKSELVRGIKPERPGTKRPILYEFNVVQLDSDCAVVSYKAVLNGAAIDRYQHLSYTWVKQAGQWKLKFQQTTVNLWSAHDLD